MDDKGAAAAADAKPIEFHGREIMTYLPNEGQIAVMARLTFWERNIGTDVERQRTGINRVGALLKGLMVNPDDWEWIEDGMAAREFEWADVLGIFAAIGDAHGLTPGNRADRRARKPAQSRARRG